MLQPCNKSGNFRVGKFSMIPFQHYHSKWMWEVIVWKDDEDERIKENIRVVANNATEAAASALKQFEKLHQDRMAVHQEILKQEKEIPARSQESPSKLQEKPESSILPCHEEAGLID